MIKANELRIGNWVKFYNSIQSKINIKVNARFFSSLAGGRSMDDVKDDEELNGYYSGIPITPEILEKCGFKKTSEFHPEGPIYSFGEHNRVDVCYLYKFVDYKQNTGRVRIFNMGYLHQLQNLYFVLTGKELEVKL